ncbi:hypothetical protein [Roseospira goensis]|uniref:Uncharacterized protein n=1 Tax=Roseospira goensis TaxID=391922 RepID=A0A7W6S154_9PROT|nr:hypothetical protein [Roseospira goensis]MBB4286807.1 hypothetical protein [Roseospira goensis]
MSGAHDDRAHLIAHRRFMEEVEMAVRAANQEIIGQKLPHLDRTSFFKLAVSIARLRARYLESVMALDWEHADADRLAAVQNRRTMFEEARAGFEALQHAFERGYITLDEK